MYELTVETEFSAAHCIRGHPGKCARLHGHNYRVAVVVAGDRLNDLDMLLDFGDAKALIAEVVGALDHTNLNELPDFAERNVTTENLARHIFNGLRDRLSASGFPVRLARVTVWEGPRSSATYSEGT
jgi:6-pyruvoyltetrahydropterin/6-carboxytetrahydropterin synthase